MTLIKKTIASLGCIGLLGSLAACGGSPEETSSPPDSAPVVAPASPEETLPKETLPEETPEMMTSPPESETPQAPTSPSSVPTDTQPAPAADEIPTAIQGRWAGTAGGDISEQCAAPDGGQILQIDAKTLGFFAAVSTLDEVQESDETSIRGIFTSQDDSDVDVTETISLELKEDGDTLDFAVLDSDVDPAPASYGRCSQ